MYFNRFDICDAYYIFAANYHGGQFSKEYRYFGRLENCRYRPAPSLSEETLSENAKEIYDNLVSKVH